MWISLKANKKSVPIDAYKNGVMKMSIIGLIVLGIFLDYIFFIYKRFAKKEYTLNRFNEDTIMSISTGQISIILLSYIFNAEINNFFVFIVLLFEAIKFIVILKNFKENLYKIMFIAKTLVLVAISILLLQRII